MPVQPFIGQIMPAGFGIVPKGWAACNGALLAINQNSTLFSLLGTSFGGDGIRTFALPDLRGRAVLGCNFTTIPWAEISGTETVTLTLPQLPSHNHVLQVATTTGAGRGSASPAGKQFGTNSQPPNSIFAVVGGSQTTLAPATNIPVTGGNGNHNNMQPFLVINYVIATSGIFPTRS